MAGRPDPPALTELSWHEHLLSCSECRALLEQEEALELLLATLPDPKLPPDLARRVVVRLRDRADENLDELLALDRVQVPEGLSDRVRRGVASARADEKLDALLELAREVEIPAGLSGRVLAGMEEVRMASRAEGARARFQLVRSLAHEPWARRAAAALLVAAGAASVWKLSGPTAPRDDDHELVAQHTVDDEEVIAMLPVLEYWDALEELDPLEQEILVQLDVSDRALMDAEDS